MAYTGHGRAVARGTLADGSRGTQQTLNIMRALAVNGSKSVPVREAALAVIKQAAIAPRDYLGEIRSLFLFVRDKIRYTRDVVDVETLQTPDYTLRMGVGDCDDKSTLLAAMLRSIGHPATLEFRAIGTGAPDPSIFRHVYVVANYMGQRIPLDPTNQTKGPGWEFPNPSVQMGVLV
jgi:transglutaminase-like putative cysteine protease